MGMHATWCIFIRMEDGGGRRPMCLVVMASLFPLEAEDGTVGGRKDESQERIGVCEVSKWPECAEGNSFLPHPRFWLTSSTFCVPTLCSMFFFTEVP